MSLGRHDWNTTPDNGGKRIAARVCVTCGMSEMWNDMKGDFVVVTAPAKPCERLVRKGVRLGGRK